MAAMELVLVAENIRSLENVGSLFRTADGLGIAKIYLTGTSGHPHPDEPWRRDHLHLSKTALGAEKTVAWEYQQSTANVLEGLHADGFWIVGLEISRQSQPISTLKQTAKIALVVGNEVAGIQPTTLASCDQVIHLPMRGSKESFNVAVACAMASYHILHLSAAKRSV